MAAKPDSPPLHSILGPHPPAYVALGTRPLRELRYLWDDTRASKDFRAEVEWLPDLTARCSVRARMVFIVGLYEWLLWRWRGLHARPEPEWVLQAAWCATIDPACMRFFEFNRFEWQGPIHGPLWCAITWLRPALMQGDDYPVELADAERYLARLCLHVTPEPALAETWMKRVIPHLAKRFPGQADDPFTDLFGRRAVARRGPWVDPAALDPARAPDPTAALAWTRSALADARTGRNPLIAAKLHWSEITRTL